MKTPGWIFTILISILMAAVLELNKNTLLGWLLFALAFAGMVVIGRKFMRGWSWWKKALSILAYLAVCAGIILITWPPIYNSLAQIIGYHDYRISLKDNYREACSEDSLYLNIWKPAGKVENAPVAVYIHGGSLQTGQPWYRDYSGEGYARDGVICVNMGYRLGVFGFLATSEMMEEEGTAGNFGLLDQIKALQWVRQNIATFGGDPDNITLIGESAGAV